MSAIDILRSFAETHCADDEIVRDGISYRTCREAVADYARLKAEATDAARQYKTISDDDDVTIAAHEAEIARLRAAVEVRDDRAIRRTNNGITCYYCGVVYKDDHTEDCPTVKYPLEATTDKPMGVK